METPAASVGSASVQDQPGLTTHEFRAMGCPVVVGGATAEELPAIAALFAEYDRVFSRFVADSELNRVNLARATVVSPLFAAALDAAYEAVELSEGLVDFTLGAALAALGYDHDYAALHPVADAPAPVRGSRLAALGWDGRVLVRPDDVQLDLNGVVKGLAVDRALELLEGPGFVACGGDLASRGPVVVGLPAASTPSTAANAPAIATGPDGADSAGSVTVEGGLATSGSLRRWYRGGWQHHLLDPRTGRPAESPWTQATVAAGSCLAADVGAKAAFLAGAAGPDWLDARSLPGRFVDEAGAVHLNEAWRRACP